MIRTSAAAPQTEIQSSGTFCMALLPKEVQAAVIILGQQDSALLKQRQGHVDGAGRTADRAGDVHLAAPRPLPNGRGDAVQPVGVIRSPNVLAAHHSPKARKTAASP